MAIQVVLNYQAARTFVAQGLYDQSDLEPEETWIIAFLNIPGGREWWDASASDFNVDLRDHIRKMWASHQPMVPDPTLAVQAEGRPST